MNLSKISAENVARALRQDIQNHMDRGKTPGLLTLARWKRELGQILRDLENLKAK